MSFFVRACVESLKLYPGLNAEMRGDHVIYKKHYDFGIAVGGGKGLVVPVVRNVDALSLAGVEKEIARLAGKAKDNTLTLDELSGGTFSISNGGIYGSMMSTPLLNMPQTGILGMHNIDQAPHGGRRRDRAPAHDVPGAVVRPPRRRRARGGAVPRRRQGAHRGARAAGARGLMRGTVAAVLATLAAATASARPPTLQSLQADVTVVAFFSTACAPCKKELPLLEALRAAVAADRRVRVVAVNVDAPHDAGAARAMARAAGLTVPLLVDASVYTALFGPGDLAVPRLAVIDRKRAGIERVGARAGEARDGFVRELRAAVSSVEAGAPAPPTPMWQPLRPR